MNRVKLYQFEEGRHRCVEFQCPGCKSVHSLTIRPHTNGSGASWGFNGSLEAPTLEPSILSKVGPFPDGCDPKGMTADRMLICHSFVTDGRIQFLGDCTHELAGQTIELPEYNPQE